MKTLVYYFSLQAKSVNPSISCGYYGLIFSSSNQQPNKVISYFLSKNKKSYEEIEEADLFIEQIDDSSDLRLKPFLKGYGNREVTEFASSKNDQIFQQCEFAKDVFAEREDGIIGILKGTKTFEEPAYGIIAVHKCDRNTTNQ